MIASANKEERRREKKKKKKYSGVGGSGASFVLADDR